MSIVKATNASETRFNTVASDEQIERTVQALEANGIHTLVAKDAEEAKSMFFELIPLGSEVFLGMSITLETLGIRDAIESTGTYDALRPKLFSMNRETQGREIRKLASAPDYAAGSVHAVTEDGRVLIGSFSGSQLGPYVSGAGKIIWVVGAQKIVKDLNEGLKRIDEHVFVLENERMQKAFHANTSLNKLLIINNLSLEK